MKLTWYSWRGERDRQDDGWDSCFGGHCRWKQFPAQWSMVMRRGSVDPSWEWVWRVFYFEFIFSTQSMTLTCALWLRLHGLMIQFTMCWILFHGQVVDGPMNMGFVLDTWPSPLVFISHPLSRRQYSMGLKPIGPCIYFASAPIVPECKPPGSLFILIIFLDFSMLFFSSWFWFLILTSWL